MYHDIPHALVSSATFLSLPVILIVEEKHLKTMSKKSIPKPGNFDISADAPSQAFDHKTGRTWSPG